MESTKYEEIQFSKRQEISFKQVLAIHLNRISFLMTRIKEHGSVASFYFAVEGLESFLKPYLTDEYQKKKDIEIAKVTESLKDMKNLKLLVWEWPSESKEPFYLEYGLALLELLQELCAQNGWLFEPDFEVPQVGVYEEADDDKG